MDSEELDKALSEEFDRLEAENKQEIIDDDPIEATDVDGDGEAAGDGAEIEGDTLKEVGDDADNAESDEPKTDPELKAAPSSWTPEAKSKYAELPEWAKKEAHKREKDVEAGIANLKEQANSSRRILDTIKPYQKFLQEKGTSVEMAVKDAVDLAYQLSNGTPQQRGVILKRLAKQVQADLTAEPDKNAEQLEPLLREIQSLKQQINSNVSYSQEAKQQEVNGLISSFENEMDEAGNPKHLYFANVRERMSAIIESGAATTLQDAYDQAIWADPTIRPLLLAQQRQEAEEKRKNEAKIQADKLRKANTVVLNKRGGHDTAPPSGTLDETLSSTYDKLVGQN